MRNLRLACCLVGCLILSTGCSFLHFAKGQGPVTKSEAFALFNRTPEKMPDDLHAQAQLLLRTAESKPVRTWKTKSGESISCRSAEPLSWTLLLGFHTKPSAFLTERQGRMEEVVASRLLIAPLFPLFMPYMHGRVHFYDNGTGQEISFTEVDLLGFVGLLGGTMRGAMTQSSGNRPPYTFVGEQDYRAFKGWYLLSGFLSYGTVNDTTYLQLAWIPIPVHVQKRQTQSP
ncbi:MAG TPA: hypothetical protein PKH07_08755 [bacterium]|nr:hypothetical protein [bacterium]